MIFFQNDSASFKDKFRCSSIRLKEWDYGWDAVYFVTICTQKRIAYFGSCNDNTVELSNKGVIAQLYWNEIPNHFSCASLGAFVIMPNHIHGILCINKTDNDKTIPETRQCLVSTNNIGTTRFQNQGKNTVSSIIGSYKSIVTKHCRVIDGDFSWQSGFYEHIVRNDDSLSNITDYIRNNPHRWYDDEYFS